MRGAYVSEQDQYVVRVTHAHTHIHNTAVPYFLE